VVIAEDNYLVREGTRQLLEIGGAVQVTAAVGTAVELLAAVAADPPDAVVTDIRMPPGHRLEGITAALEIRRRHREVGVVVLSNHADDEYALQLFADGTAGLAYLLKERVGDRAELLRAITETAAGRSVIDPVVVESLVRRRISEERDGTASALSTLTPRERTVLDQMAAGLSNTAIAERLHLSRSAIEKHVSAIFTKLGLVDEPATHRRVAAVVTYLADDSALPRGRRDPGTR
jgi:DNA-binding NarL/FixJ family response regulator